MRIPQLRGRGKASRAQVQRPAPRPERSAGWAAAQWSVVLIVVVETVCVISLLTANLVERPTSTDIWRFLALLAISGVYAEGGARLERLRSFVANTTFSNASSLWCFAAALVLPMGLAGAFVMLLYGHELFTGVRSNSARPRQLIYTGSTEVLATLCAGAVVAHFHAGRGQLGNGVVAAAAVGLALIAYAMVNQALVTAVIYLVTRPARITDAMLSRDDELLEVVTLGLAVLFAIALVAAPYLAPFTLPVIVVLRRSALVRELRVQALRDAKTGLLNARGWRQEAERELVRAERVGAKISVLMVDLDHFKVLNDSYGHPAGDATLKAVADCLTDALRGYDAVGRFGGEEFIAVLTDADETVAAVVAQRLCDRIRAIELTHGNGVTASIGVGVGVSDVHDLDELIEVADQALYVAKRCGRDQVHLAMAPESRVDRGQR